MSFDDTESWLPGSTWLNLTPVTQNDNHSPLEDLLIGHSSPLPTGRPPTPAPCQDMDPLQRWRNSPPEDEPAQLEAIASALRSRRRFPSSYKTPNFDIPFSSGPSRGPSSRSSSNASCSIASSSSSHWQAGSDHSGSFSSSSRITSPRRRRWPKNKPRHSRRTRLSTQPRPFQCTFCTDTFKAKYDWERHEKSLHLSLEQWLCSRDGPTAMLSAERCCVYCGQQDPDDHHLQHHNHMACIHRPADERTFYRKDHLQQHLRLVHKAQFLKPTMETWSQTVDMKSRCGFCDAGMSSWRQRADHLSRHFKEGTTMASWQGDWGLDPTVLPMVENAIPPYLIDLERSSPYPFSPNRKTPTTPSSAYELLDTEISYYALRYHDEHGRDPPVENLHYQSCCVIFGSETSAAHYAPSWLRDLLINGNETAMRARMAPLSDMLSPRATQLRINGKSDIFKDCVLEGRLVNFAMAMISEGRGLTVMALQKEVCSIIDGQKGVRSDVFPFFLKKMAFQSVGWLAPFAERVVERGVTVDLGGLSQIHPILDEDEYLRADVTGGLGFDDLLQLDLNDTSVTDVAPRMPPLAMQPTLTPSSSFPSQVPDFSIRLPQQQQQHGAPFFLAGSNGYDRLFFELSRFVTRSISLNNPNPHIPSDAELQFQARWIIYDDDDPLNQTPADNPTWLFEFKQKLGIS